MASTTRLAVAKSVAFSSRRIVLLAPSTEGTVRSTVAPPEMRPTLKWLMTTELPAACAPTPPTSTLPCAMPYTWPSAPFSGVISKVPPRRLFALPIDDTVTSSSWPGWANAGKAVVTITAATFFNCKLVPCGKLMPCCCSIAATLWMVKGVCVVWSPLPSRPTTRP